MELSKNLSLTEYIFISLFVVAYLAYLIRVIRVSQQLKTTTKSFLYKLILRSVAFFLIIIALLSPTFGEKTKKEIKAKGKDIYFLVDISRSMDASDIQPSRLEKVKFQLKNIVKAFSSDRLGLIVFSSDAFLQCPLTFDNSAIMLFIETMRTGLVSSFGTDFAPPLRLALDKLTNDENTAQSAQKSKIIILISDGEDFGSEASSIAKEIEESGIKLFTVGVGTTSGGKIPDGYTFKKDRKGEEILTSLNSNSLKELANITGSKYFEISDKQNDIPRLIKMIGSIEGELREAREIDVADNKYFYFLLAAFILIVADIIISIRILRI
jgi:Ca-activated chloride channel family protein